jgi:hypothetical protein
MPSIHDSLVDRAPSLRPQLEKQEQDAEIRLAKRYHRLSSVEAFPLPKDGAAYSEYPPSLLALLWATVGNRAALRALRTRLALNSPDSTNYERMDSRLLSQLWLHGGDGEALAELWIRAGTLPLGVVTDAVADNVLGLIAWGERRLGPRSWTCGQVAVTELARRYPSPATDNGQEHALTLLRIIERWDFLKYTTLAPLLSTSYRNRRIDLGRRQKKQPKVAPTGEEVEAKAEDAGPVVGVDLEALDFIQTHTPADLRIIEKARLGIRLSPEELDRAARRNLETRRKRVTEKTCQSERTRITRWLVENPEPTGQELTLCFAWFNPSRHAIAARSFRLRHAADQSRSLLEGALADRNVPFADEARLASRKMCEAITLLLEFVTTGHWTERKSPVEVYAHFEDAAADLWAYLGRAHRGTGELLDATLECINNVDLFCESFTALAKMAACWRLGRKFALRSGSVAEMLAWSEQGRWRNSVPKQDKDLSRTHRADLAALAGTFSVSDRACLDLLLEWLDAVQQPEPASRLRRLDRVWRLSHDARHDWPPSLPELADALVAAEVGRDGARVNELCDDMLALVRSCPASLWSGVRVLQDCLRSLQGQAGSLTAPAR